MALVPGLKEFSEDRPDVSRKPSGRVVLKDASPGELPRLRPTATPVETYARPNKGVQDNSLSRLAESLAAFNPSLLRFSEAYMKDEDKVDAEFNKRLNSMTPAEAMAKIKDGSDPEFSSRISKAKNQELFAARVAQDTFEKAKEEWATENKDGLNVDDFIAKKNKEVLATYGGKGQEGFINEYLRLVNPRWDSLRGAQTKHDVEKTNTEKMQGVTSLFQLTVENGRSAGKTPDEIAKTLRNEINGNRILAGLDPRQQEAELLNQTEIWANSGDYDLVKAVVSSKGTNGISLLDNRDHGAKAAALLERDVSPSRMRVPRCLERCSAAVSEMEVRPGRPRQP